MLLIINLKCAQITFISRIVPDPRDQCITGTYSWCCRFKSSLLTYESSPPNNVYFLKKTKYWDVRGVMDNHIAVTKKTNGNFNTHIFAAKIIKKLKNGTNSEVLTILRSLQLCKSKVCHLFSITVSIHYNSSYFQSTILQILESIWTNYGQKHSRGTLL